MRWIVRGNHVETRVVTPAAQSAEILRAADRVVVLTGAGMSAESGVPTFRDALTGLWSTFDPQRLATPEAFLADPAMVFGWYLSRIRSGAAVTPHAGYGALVQLEARFQSLVVVTQNVDGLHTRSGSRRVIELHGSLARARCFHRGHPYPDDQMLELATTTTDEPVNPPPCPECGSPVRPGVVWFGESLPVDAVEEAWSVVGEADAVLVVGTSSVVYPAAELPSLAHQAGARVIEINPNPTPFSDDADVYWNERAGLALPELVAMLTRSSTDS